MNYRDAMVVSSQKRYIRSLGGEISRLDLDSSAKVSVLRRYMEAVRTLLQPFEVGKCRGHEVLCWVFPKL